MASVEHPRGGQTLSAGKESSLIIKRPGKGEKVQVEAQVPQSSQWNIEASTSRSHPLVVHVFSSCVWLAGSERENVISPRAKVLQSSETLAAKPSNRLHPVSAQARKGAAGFAFVCFDDVAIAPATTPATAEGFRNDITLLLQYLCASEHAASLCSNRPFLFENNPYRFLAQALPGVRLPAARGFNPSSSLSRAPSFPAHLGGGFIVVVASTSDRTQRRPPCRKLETGKPVPFLHRTRAAPLRLLCSIS
jgi:hypothetical protein